MISKYRSATCIFGIYMQKNLPSIANPINYPCNTVQQVRNHKHYNPKFKKERKEKFIKVDLPNYEKDSDDITREEIRSRMKKMGLVPHRNWSERPIFVGATPNIFESYVVPEGDGKFSTLTAEGAKQKYQFLEKKSKSYMAIRKIRSYDETFAVKTFVDQALDIYKKAHETLTNFRNDKDALLQYVTETAYPQMIHNIADKTVHWQFLQSLEPAYVVHARNTALLTKSNIFAQVTIRFHTQQILCIYDRFGRVMLGSEILKKDVLDYVVFEKHLSNMYGTWRIHGKIIPSWMPPEEVAVKTYMLPKQEESSSPGSELKSIAKTVRPVVSDEPDTQELNPATR